MTSAAQPGSISAQAQRFDRTRLAGTQINQQTLLATDYLNHFNEVVMLIDMLPSLPDCIDELEAWREMSYQEHFSQSGLRYAELAIEAYDHAPAHARKPFDEAAARLNAGIREAIVAYGQLLDKGEPAVLQQGCEEIVALLTRLTDRIGAIINGHISASGDDDHAQDAVDALFDD